MLSGIRTKGMTRGTDALLISCISVRTLFWSKIGPKCIRGRVCTHHMGRECTIMLVTSTLC